jgi:ABC-type cobalamin/Fe3+-siderophores transport system ATPase subunit
MIEEFLKFIDLAIDKLRLHKDLSVRCGVDKNMLDLHDEIISYCSQVRDAISNAKLTIKINYLNQVHSDIDRTLIIFPYINQQNLNFIQTDSDRKEIKQQIESRTGHLSEQLKLLQSNLDFFKRLNFFSKNIVAIGANGSGKTTLSNYVKQYLLSTGIVISAQKLLIIPTFYEIPSFSKTSKNLQTLQQQDRSLKETYSANGGSGMIMSRFVNEFEILLGSLFAERNVARNKFCDNFEKGNKDSDLPRTNLDCAIKIWNSLISHRTLEVKDGITLTLKTDLDVSYSAYQMSDGEKVALYLIAQILQAPENGFVIVDEPEMYLHKTILTKLWDILEDKRKDCIFIYLTHDLDFAISRTLAKKVWIKSFNFPDKWEIEDIPENELPEVLLLKLLGSRKNILFCEGQKGSVDEKIYNILFPDFMITPVESCSNVINYAKVFNKIPNLTTKAFGLIDSDYHETDRLKKLRSDSIFSFSIVEPENLFLDESFLNLLAKKNIGM